MTLAVERDVKQQINLNRGKKVQVSDNLIICLHLVPNIPHFTFYEVLFHMIYYP